MVRLALFCVAATVAGVAWAEDLPVMTPARTDVKPFEYVPANVPFYPAGKAWGTTDAGPRTMQKPLDPAESLKHYVHPVGFELRPFVTEDQLGGKPIAMTWDERGRLYVAVTVDYPNKKQPDGQGHDKILLCEDTAGAGRANRVTVFADKLSIPTSLLCSHGGLIVHQPPHTLFLKDTDGDGHADERRVLFTGWHTSDTHAGPSNMRYGLDNWIYGMVGYAGFDGTVGGERLSFRSGFYRFRPDGSKMEFLRNTSNNSWGVGFSEEGILFGSTANGEPSVHLAIPNRYYEAVRGWSSSVLRGIADSNNYHPITDKIRQVDFHGGFTAAAGHALYTARTYPKQYWNRTAFVSDPTGHLTATFVLRRDGATYRAHYGWNLVASDDEWAAPIAAEVGPDGNVWVIDWYSYIVQHNPTPPGFKTGRGNAYETDLRDTKHGRIYRLVYAAAPPAKTLNLADASPAALVASLKNDNMFWRLQAQRLLVERGRADVAPELRKLAADQSQDAIGLNVGAIHALWTLHGLGVAIRDIAAALRHPSAGVRRTAVQVLPRNAGSVAYIAEAKLLHDADPQVRLAALLAMANMPPTDLAAGMLASAMMDPTILSDRWLSEAATCAAARNDGAFLNQINRLPRGAGAIVERVADHYARGRPTPAAELWTAMSKADPAVAAAAIAGLSRGWRQNYHVTIDAASEQAWGQLYAKLPAGAKAQLLTLLIRMAGNTDRLAGQLRGVTDELMRLVRDAKAAEAARITAAAQLIDLRPTDTELIRGLLELVTPQLSPDMAGGLIDAVRRSKCKTGGQEIVKRFATLAPAAKRAAIRALLDQQVWTPALLDAMETGAVRPEDFALDQKQSLLNHPLSALADRAKALFSRGGGLPDPDRDKVLQSLLPLMKQTGNADAGKLVFKNQCAKCHRYNGEGATIGPDLSGVAVHPKDHLLTDIIDPSRSVEGNFRIYRVTTASGRIINGLLASETKTSVEIVDAEGKTQAFPREEIESLQGSTKSLMPDGFEKQISKTELIDLLEFLTKRGKYLPLSLDKVATVVSTRGMFHGPESEVERMIFADWGPKTFHKVPFLLVDPKGDRVPNVVMLNGPQGVVPPRMPKSVRLPVNSAVKVIHMLGGVGGWSYPGGTRGSVSMIVRLHYADGAAEDHPLKNGEQLADYIRRVDVPGSEFAFDLRGRQVRYLAIKPTKSGVIGEIELLKGSDRTAPIVVAVTVELPE